jgi:crossover junction endonuclease MUS81
MESIANCIIEVDEREGSLFDQLHQIFEQRPPKNLQLTKKVLPLGDILIWGPKDAIPFVLVERKSFPDLLASIKDGRYQEQSHRLIHSSGVHRHHILYLIEGVPSQTSMKEMDLIYSVITSLNMYKGFSVYRTAHVQESAEFLVALAKKVVRNALDKNEFPLYWSATIAATDIPPTPPPNTPAAYCAVVKKEKKENITPENICEIILCQIPGISSVSAQAIAAKYSTIRSLIEAIYADPDSLNDIYLTAPSGQKRKLSKAIMESIRRFLVVS